MKKYIAKNARFFIQIKLFQCSKQLQKIIKQYRGKQCGRLFVYNLPHLEIDFGAENIYVTGNPSNKYFDKKKPLKVIGGLYWNHYLLKPGDFEMLYPTLDLSELKVLKVSHKITLNSSIFYKYLVETLVEIDLCDVEVENVDIPLAVLKQCPLATKINVPWNKHLTAMSKMAVVERKTKIKEFVIDNISQILHLEDVVNFVKNQMDTNGFICLKNPLKWLPDMTPSVRYYNRHVLNPFIHISSEIFCTFYKDTF